jgi:potassium uptake Trk family protein
MSLLDANMTAFQTGYYLLITMGFLILAGNTCYPVFLRLIVWTMLKIVERFEGEAWTERAATLRFLLDHPRRCYTNLFPAQHTWWLLLMVITLNGIYWAAFEVLNIGNPKIDGSLPFNVRVIDGLFQALAVRSGGFFVVTISDLRIGLQVLYVVMMYISVYPVVITMRNSNVYEERSLGIYAEDTVSELDKPITPMPHMESENSHGWLSRARSIASNLNHARPQESNTTFVRHQLRAQLAHDAWTIILALFLIMIIESHKFAANPSVYSVFNFLFEIVSGYGCVGISVGVPWDVYSFCGSWQTLSKLILCAVMIKGRHRGLPVAIDKAVLLPGEEDGRVEEEDGRIRLARVGSRETGRV